MEIERRFLVAGFPDEKPTYKAWIEQGYLCTGEIEARIRKTVKEERTTYKLAFKSDGTLSRKEVEFEIDKAQYEALLSLVEGEMIKKDYRVYPFGKYQLEVCEVDPQTDGHYYYAEIEFENEEEALTYDATCIPHVLEEVTYDKSYNMKNYWQVTRIEKKRFR